MSCRMQLLFYSCLFVFENMDVIIVFCICFSERDVELSKPYDTYNLISSRIVSILSLDLKKLLLMF